MTTRTSFVLHGLLSALFFLVPLNTRLVIDSVVQGFHEYETLFFYATDVILISLILYAGLYACELFAVRKNIIYSILGLFVLCLSLSFFAAPSLLLSFYAGMRILILCIVAYLCAHMWGSQGAVRLVAILLTCAALLQGCLGIYQFAAQKSAGLTLFGETTLISYRGPSSTIRAQGGRFLRAYGTFPHPNVLASFLALGLISCGYLYVKSDIKLCAQVKKQKIHEWFRKKDFLVRMTLAGVFFIITLSLILTFSRSGWIAASIGLIALCLLSARQSFGAVMRFILLVIVSSSFAYILLKPLIAPRATLSRYEPAVSERVSYTRLGLEMMSRSPLGVGVGNQVLYGVRQGIYKEFGMTRLWQWEPVHNLYILVGVELGWLGLLSFALFLVMVLGRLIRRSSLEAGLSLALLLTLLVAGLFDHFLWTLQPGRLMLWLAIGLALAQAIKKPSSFNG